jgi:hypothetical protein
MTDPQSRPLTKRRMLVVAGMWGVLGGIALLLAGWLTGYRTLDRLGLVATITGAAWLVCARFTDDEPIRAAGLRYAREFFPAMLAYVLILLLVWPLVEHVQHPAARVAIALLPVAPVAFVVRAMVRLMLASDELERRMQLEAISIASLSVGLLSFSAGFLQAAGVLHLQAALMWVLPALFLAYGLAMWWARRRYRGE